MANSRRTDRARRAKLNGCSALEHPFGEVLPESGEVAGDHRGAFPLRVSPVPVELVVVDGDHVTVEGDLEGLVAGQPRPTACEQVVGAGLEAVVGDQGGGDGVDVLHGGSSSFLGLLPLSLILL